MSTRAEQKEKRRWQILDAALDQFIRRGYAATKIKDIADKVGMSVGLLFHYFGSKEALYTELMRLGTAAPQEMLNSFGPVEPLDFFELCAKRTLEFASSSAFTSKMFVLMSNAYYSEGIPEEARAIAITCNFYKDLVPLIEQGQRNGTIRSGSPLALSTSFWTALQGSIEAYALNPDLPLPEAEWIVDIIRAKKENEGHYRGRWHCRPGSRNICLPKWI